MIRKSSNARVQKHREAPRRAGLRPVQIRVPDTRRTDTALQCRSQSRRVAAADRADTQLSHLLEDALAERREPICSVKAILRAGPRRSLIPPAAPLGATIACQKA